MPLRLNSLNYFILFILCQDKLLACPDNSNLVSVCSPVAKPPRQLRWQSKDWNRRRNYETMKVRNKEKTKKLNFGFRYHIFFKFVVYSFLLLSAIPVFRFPPLAVQTRYCQNQKSQESFISISFTALVQLLLFFGQILLRVQRNLNRNKKIIYHHAALGWYIACPLIFACSF